MNFSRTGVFLVKMDFLYSAITPKKSNPHYLTPTLIYFPSKKFSERTYYTRFGKNESSKLLLDSERFMIASNPMYMLSSSYYSLISCKSNPSTGSTKS